MNLEPVAALPLVTLINAGDLKANLSAWLRIQPEHAPAEYASLLAQSQAVPVQNVYIVAGATSILVDATRFTFDNDPDYGLAGYMPPPSLIDQLDAIGVTPGSIGHVVITHPHDDHISALIDANFEPQFYNARHYIGAADWDWLERSAPDGEAINILKRLDVHRLLVRVDGDRALTNEIEILAAPGETPGHQIVRARLFGGQNVYCIGDLFHHEVEYANPDWQVYWCDAAVNARSRARIMNMAREDNAAIIATHVRGMRRFVAEH